MSRTHEMMADMRARWDDRPWWPPRWWWMRLPRWAINQFWYWPTPRAAWRLWRVGRIEWAWLLHANAGLFDPGERPAPGTVLWSPDPQFAAEPHLLQQIHDTYWNLKERNGPDGRSLALVPGLEGLWHAGNDDYRRSNRAVMSPMLAGSRLVYVESVLFQRHHLPGRRLGASFMPIVVDPRARVRPVMMLPAPLWPDALSAEWTEA